MKKTDLNKTLFFIRSLKPFLMFCLTILVSVKISKANAYLCIYENDFEEGQFPGAKRKNFD